MSFDADKSELARDIWAKAEALEAERMEQEQCWNCEEWYAEKGIWFRDFSLYDGAISICPDCWLEYMWNNYIDGIGWGSFLDLMENLVKQEKKRIGANELR